MENPIRKRHLFFFLRVKLAGESQSFVVTTKVEYIIYYYGLCIDYRQGFSSDRTIIATTTAKQYNIE